MGAVREGRRGTQGKAHCPDGGDRFHQHRPQANPVHSGYGKGRSQYHREIQHQDAARLPEHLSADAAAEAFHLFFVFQFGENGQKQHGKGGGLDSPCRGAGGPADEHQRAGEEDAPVGELGEVYGIKARRPHRDRLEQGKKAFLPGRPVGKGIPVPFQQGKQHCAAQQQHTGGHQHQLAVELVPAEGKLVLHNIRPNVKPQPSNYHQRHDYAYEKRISRHGGEGGKGLGLPHQIKARIAEGGDRVEHRFGKSSDHPLLGTEPDSQQRSPDPLYEYGAEEDKTGHPDNAAHLGGGNRFLHHKPVAQADFPPHKHDADNGEGHKPNAPYLNQRQNHQLPE